MCLPLYLGNRRTSYGITLRKYAEEDDQNKSFKHDLRNEVVDVGYLIDYHGDEIRQTTITTPVPNYAEGWDLYEKIAISGGLTESF